MHILALLLGSRRCRAVAPADRRELVVSKVAANFTSGGKEVRSGNAGGA